MTHIDTAEMYGNGAVERFLCDVVAAVPRDDLFLASKVLPSHAGYDDTIAACERSLQRLGVDYLDLYMLHWPSHVPLAQTMAALADLVKAGKTRFVGVSNFDVDEMLEAKALLGDVPLTCNQVLYHLRERGIEHRLIPAALREDIAIVAYTPFGRGQYPREAAKEENVLGSIAKKHGVSSRAVILAFLTRHANAFTIPKASSIAHVEENAAAGDVRLDASDIAAIDSAFPIGDDGPIATL
jgi:diketogulonate reductase-like aldo/keto reductase